MAAATPTAQEIEVTRAMSRGGLRVLYQHFTGIDDTETHDFESPIVHCGWEGATDGDLGSVTFSGSTATMNSGGAINGAIVAWVPDWT